MTRDQRNHTADRAVSAGHAADRVVEQVWQQTGDGTQALLAGSEAYRGLLKENILDEFPPCPNDACELHGSPARVAHSHVDGQYYCYECCQTFDWYE